MTDAAVLRMLINHAVRDRGLDAPPTSSKLRPSSRPAPEPTGSRGAGGAPAKPERRGGAIPPGSGSRGGAVAGANARKTPRPGTKRGKVTKER
jgi:hypothetical protein